MGNPNLVIVALIAFVIIVWIGFQVHKEIKDRKRFIEHKKEIARVVDEINKKGPRRMPEIITPSAISSSPDPTLYPGGHDFPLFGYVGLLNNSIDDSSAPQHNNQNDSTTGDDSGSYDSGDSGSSDSDGGSAD